MIGRAIPSPRRPLAAALLTALLLGASPHAAAASNSTSTHAFILANYRLVRVSEGRIGLMQHKAKTAELAVLRQCRGSANGSPQDEQSSTLGYEAAGVLWSAAYKADAGPIAGLVRATARLRWSNRRTSREVARYVSSLRKLAQLPMPHLCEDIAAWKASGFQTLPAATTRLAAYLETIEATPVPPRLLVPYEQPGDAPLFRRTQRIEAKLLEAETYLGGNDWYDLTEALELNP